MVDTYLAGLVGVELAEAAERDPSGSLGPALLLAARGNPGRMEDVGDLLADGRPDDAMHWYARAADLGRAGAMTRAGVLRARHGDLADARQWWTRGMRAGDAEAMKCLGSLLNGLGEHDTAERCLRQAIAAGVADEEKKAAIADDIMAAFDGDGMHGGVADEATTALVAVILEAAGRAADADRWWAVAWDGDALERTAEWLTLVGDDRGAAACREHAAEAPMAIAWDTPFDAATGRPRPPDPRGDRVAQDRRDAEAGDTNAMFTLGAALHSNKDFAGAHMWWERAAALGHVDAAVTLGMFLTSRNNLIAAERLLRPLADEDATAAHAGVSFATAGEAAAYLALGYQRRHRDDLAEEYWARVRHGGDPVNGLVTAARRLDDEGDQAGATECWRRLAEVPDAAPLAFMLPELITRGGLPDPNS